MLKLQPGFRTKCCFSAEGWAEEILEDREEVDYESSDDSDFEAV